MGRRCREGGHPVSCIEHAVPVQQFVTARQQGGKTGQLTV